MKNILSIRKAGFVNVSSRAILLLLVLATTSIFILSATTVARGASPNDVTKTLEAFSDFFPGQMTSMKTLEAQGFTCREGSLPTPADVTMTCQKSLDNTAFSQMTLAIWDGKVRTLNFNVRENALTAGDLVLAYGTPEITSVNTGVALNWSEAGVSASNKVGGQNFSYLMPLSQVSIHIV